MCEISCGLKIKVGYKNSIFQDNHIIVRLTQYCNLLIFLPIFRSKDIIFSLVLTGSSAKCAAQCQVKDNTALILQCAAFAAAIFIQEIKSFAAQ